MAQVTNRETMDEIEMQFVEQIGHKPKSVQQILHFCQQNNIDRKYKEINTWWKQKLKMEQIAQKQSVYNTDSDPSTWKVNTWLLVFSRSQNKWFPALIDRIIDDNKLCMKYNATTKKISKTSKNIKAFPLNHPMLFQKGTKCKIYSSKIFKWCKGMIIDIFSDDEGEWLKVQYQQNKVQKICDIQRFSNDIITDCELEGSWDDNIESIEGCTVDNIIYILRNYVFHDGPSKNKKFEKSKEKIIGYFHKCNIDGTKISFMKGSEFSNGLMTYLKMKSDKKMQSIFVDIFNQILSKFEDAEEQKRDHLKMNKIKKNLDQIKKNLDKMDTKTKKGKEDEGDESSAHSFSPKQFTVTF